LRYDSYLRIFADETIHTLLPAMPTSAPGLAAEFDRLRGKDDVETALAVDRVTYLPGDLLTKVDRASMLHNLEVRAPFMDHTLGATRRLAPTTAAPGENQQAAAGEGFFA
jgi:hypothetical protein